MNTTTAVPDLSRDQMINLGILTMAVSPYPDLPMVQVIKILLASPSTNLTATLGPVFNGAGYVGVDARLSLKAVDSYFNTLPHDESATYVQKLGVAMTAVATAFLILRIVGRKQVMGYIRMDDWMMVFAWIQAVLFLGLIHMQKGYHIWDESYNGWKHGFFMTWLLELLFCVNAFTIKLSWLIFFWIIAPIPWFRKAVLAVGVFSFLTTFVAIIALAFQCRPFNFWNDPLNAKCIDLAAAVLVLGNVGILQDFMILLLPVPVVIYTLRLATKEKIIVIAMFCCGTFACYAGIIRQVYSKHFVSDLDMPYLKNLSGLWVLVEHDLAIALSAIPAIRGMLRQLFPQYFNSSSFPLSPVLPPPAVAKGAPEVAPVSGSGSGIMQRAREIIRQGTQSLAELQDPSRPSVTRSLSIISVANDSGMTVMLAGAGKEHSAGASTSATPAPAAVRADSEPDLEKGQVPA